MRLIALAGVAAVCLLLIRVTPASADWAIAGYFGATHTMSSGLSVTQPAVGTDVTFASIDYEGESFRSPIYYGYRISYVPAAVSWLGVETEFIHMKVQAQTERVTGATGRRVGTPIAQHIRVDDVLERFSISHGLNFVLVNVVIRRALARHAGAEGRLVLVGRAGLGPTIPHAESRIDGAVHEGYELGALGLQMAAGIETRLIHQLSATAEYKVTHSNQHVAVSQGEASGEFTSHHGVFGRAWRF